MKRFWSDVGIEPGDLVTGAGWRVLLDGRPVRLPGGTRLLLPTQALAIAVAEEWQVAGGALGGEMSYADVPLTRIAGTGQERVVGNPEPAVLELTQYAESDLLCYRAARPAELRAREDLDWQPWLDWLAQRHGAHLHVTTGVGHISQPARSLAALAHVLAGFDPLALAALGIIVPALGSLVLALAVADGALAAGDAFDLATLDERFQAELWGQDAQAVQRRRLIRQDVIDAGRFLQLLRDSTV